MPAIEGTAASEEKLRGRGKVRNKIGAEQRTERGKFVTDGKKLMLLPELKGWVYREIVVLLIGTKR